MRLASSQHQEAKQQLVTQLVDLKKTSEAYFNAKNKEDALIMDVEYAKKPIPVGHRDYVGQNPGLPDHAFGAMYRKDAKIWAQKDLANITIRASEILYDTQGWKLKVMDCLRTVEAQAMMQNVVKENNWSDEYVSPPGGGAHPRAMAIDVVPMDIKTRKLINMGSEFDHFEAHSNRDFEQFSKDKKTNKQILENRNFLDQAMLMAAKECGFEGKLVLLPSEWWDYRFTEDIWQQYPPLSEADLPKEMRLTE